MGNLTLVIIDDELNARQLLEEIISESPSFSIVASCADVDTAFREIQSQRPDAVLLDIQLPKKDGFFLVEMMKTLDHIPEIIFVTAYEQYAIRAIKAAAFDYLLKPVRKDELRSSLDKLLLKKRNSMQRARIENLLKGLERRDKLRFNDREGYHLVDPSDILFITASGNYCEVEIINGKNLLVSLNLGKIEKSLPASMFSRVSRSCIINTDYLFRIDRKKMTCLLKNDEIFECVCSKSYLKALEDKF